MIRLLNRRIKLMSPITGRCGKSNCTNNEHKRKVKIVEVGPRDGLQNEPSSMLSAEQKITFIKHLIKAGCQFIECGSFVSPQWVPAMANSKEVLIKLNQWRDGELKLKNDGNSSCSLQNTVFSVLTPNLRGFYDAIDAGGVNEVAIFGAASETFSQKNIGCSIDESLTRFQQVTDAAKAQSIPVRGYISCTLGCPYEKQVDPAKVTEVADKLMELGCHEISLGDTIGVGTPLATIQMINDVKTMVDPEKIAVHFHDTYGQALANIYAALGEGINTIDSSVAGLGGCPYAGGGASGNVSSEDVLYMLEGMNIDTGINLKELIKAGDYICAQLGKENRSKCANALRGCC